MWFFYGTKELAEKCEKWCTEHRSCNLEIIKQAVNFQENSDVKKQSLRRGIFSL